MENCDDIFTSWALLTLFRMGLFGTAHGGGGRGKKNLPKICHTYLIMKLGTVIVYLKKIQKIYESRVKPLDFCWHQHFFTGNHQILLCQEIQIKIPFWCVNSYSFNFFWVFKNDFNKHGHNFDDVSKNGYCSPS